MELENEADWRAFCVVIGVDALAEDRRFATVEARWQHSQELDRAIEGWTCSRSAHQAMFQLQKAGIAAGVVQNGEDLYRDPQLRSRGFITEITHPDLGTIEYPQSPHRLSKTPGYVRRPSSRLGQYNDYVFAGWLGLSEQEIAALVAEGIV